MKFKNPIYRDYADCRADDTTTSPVIDQLGTKSWIQEGVLHREDGPALICLDGIEEWWLYGKRHRLGGPAIIRPDGTEEWWFYGQTHRVDGPAVTWGKGIYSWVLYGTLYSDFSDWFDDNKYLTDEEKLMLKLQYG